MREHDHHHKNEPTNFHKTGSYAGSLEKRAQAIQGLIQDPTRQRVEFKVPQPPGPYRIFVTILDNRGHAAYGNVPFFSEEN